MKKLSEIEKMTSDKPEEEKKYEGGGEYDKIEKLLEQYYNVISMIHNRPLMWKIRKCNPSKLKIIIYDNLLSSISTKHDPNSTIKRTIILPLSNFLYCPIDSFLNIENSDMRGPMKTKLFSAVFDKNNINEIGEKYTANKEKKKELTDEEDTGQITLTVSELLLLVKRIILLKKIEGEGKRDYIVYIYICLLDILGYAIESCHQFVVQIPNTTLDDTSYNHIKDNIDFNKALDALYQDTNQMELFIKFRNDDFKINKWNRRFNVILNESKPTTFLMQYDDTDTPYYQLSTIKKRTNITEINKPPIPYPYSYAFGQFSNIFVPNLSNQEIAEKMKSIKDKLINGENVFMIGYGASGSGKTSSLIYFKPFNGKAENGILVHLCNQLSDKFTHIELICIELYATTDSQDTIINKKSPSKMDSIVFHVKDNSFVLEQKYSHENYHRYRSDNKIIEEFEKGTPLGEVIVHLVDTDRFVRATTNNPQSSRSHSLVFLRFKKDDEIKSTLIIGDFAGVENEFTCENPSTLNDFLSVKQSNGTPYYSKLSKSMEADKIMNIGTVEGGGAEDILQNKRFLQTTELPFDFNNPVIRETWKLGPYLENFYNQPDNFKLAIELIIRYAIGDKLPPYTDDEHKYFIDKINGINIKNFENELSIFSMDDNIESFNEELDTIKGKISTYLLNDRNLIRSDRGNSSYKKLIKLHPKTGAKYESQMKFLNREIERLSKQYYIPHTPIEPDIDFFVIPDALSTDSTNKKIEKIEIIRNHLESKIFTKIRQYFQDINDRIKEKFENVVNGITKEKFSDIRQSIFEQHGPMYSNLVDLVKGMELEMHYRIQYARDICTHRRGEGVFINESLHDMRNVIQAIIYKKNKDNVDSIPYIMNPCLTEYCENPDSCFTMTDPSDNSTSHIFKTMTDTLGLSLDELIPKLTLSVFCVVNLSRMANNPPPVPYLDINRLKRLKIEMKSFRSETKVELIERNRENLCEELKQINEKIDSKFHGKLDWMKTIPYIDSNLIDLIDDIVNDQQYFNNDNGRLNQTGEEILTNFIEMIDKNNAASTIGTLEFMDVLSKFYNTQNICRIPDGNLNPQIIHQYIPDAKPLYASVERSGGRRALTRRQKTTMHHLFTKHRTMKK